MSVGEAREGVLGAIAERGESFAIFLRGQGGLEVEYYAPIGTDPQQPHDRDELYFVERGSGIFVVGGERIRFAAGDMLFVAAGVEHRFEDFGSTFGVWVVFFGRKRGGVGES
ncbi:MAG: cupin domain-containing protein [Alphaproteobacteria bacterium]